MAIPGTLNCFYPWAASKGFPKIMVLRIFQGLFSGALNPAQTKILHDMGYPKSEVHNDLGNIYFIALDKNWRKIFYLSQNTAKTTSYFQQF